MNGGVVANTLESEVQLGISLATFHLDALFATANGIKVSLFDKTDESESDRGLVLSFLVGGNDSLKTHTGVLRGTSHIGRNGLGIVFRDIQYFSTSLQRAVCLVGSWLIIIFEGKSLTTVVLHLQQTCLAGKCRQLRTVAIHRNNSQLIVCTSLQTHHISTSVGAVVANQFSVDLCKVAILASFDVDIVFSDIIIKVELHIGRLQPPFGLCNVNFGCDGFRKRDGSHIIMILVLSCRHLAIVEGQFLYVSRIIVFRGAIRQFQLYLIFGGILGNIALCLSVHAHHQGEQREDR